MPRPTRIECIKQDFNELQERISSDEEELCYFFNQGIENLEEGHHEIAFLLFCTVIEAITAQRNYNEYTAFSQWLRSDNRLDDFAEDFEEDPNSALKEWKDEYNETYGVRRNFAATVIEAYRDQGIVPRFMRIESEQIGEGTVQSSQRTEPFESEDELFEEFESIVKDIYDDYRSPLIHAGEPLHPFVHIQTEVGGIETPNTPSVQTIADLALTVLEENLEGD